MANYIWLNYTIAKVKGTTVHGVVKTKVAKLFQAAKAKSPAGTSVS